MRIAIALVMVMALTACGGGGTPVENPPGNNPPPVQDVDPAGWWDVWAVDSPNDTVVWRITAVDPVFRVDRVPGIDGGASSFIGTMTIEENEFILEGFEIGINVRADYVLTGEITGNSMTGVDVTTETMDSGRVTIETTDFAGERRATPPEGS